MNFKLNLWTLLFFLSLGAMAYMMFIQLKSGSPYPNPSNPYVTNPEVTYGTLPPPIDIDKLIQEFQIEKDTFLDQKNNYTTRYIKTVRDPNLNLKNRIGVDAMGIEAYSLQEEELDAIYDHYSEIDQNNPTKPDVFVYPIIKDTIHPDGVLHREFDLVFLITSKDRSSEYFFDFTEPCPPVCGSNNVPYRNPLPLTSNTY